jgi:hypothetical protein
MRAVIITALFLSCSPVVAQPLVVPHEFRASENGSFGQKTLIQLNTNEFRTGLTAACLWFGYVCGGVAVAIGSAAAYATPYVSNNDVQTTAWVDWHRGEEYAAKFAAPSGYTTCRALIDVNNGSITGGATFNGSIQRMAGPNQDGIGLYAVVPKNRPSGQWVSFRVDVEFVPVGTVQQNKCWPDNTVVFQCTGQNCNTYPGARK